MVDGSQAECCSSRIVQNATILRNGQGWSKTVTVFDAENNILFHVIKIFNHNQYTQKNTLNSPMNNHPQANSRMMKHWWNTHERHSYMVMCPALLSYSDALLSYSDALLSYSDALLSFSDSLFLHSDALLSYSERCQKLPLPLSRRSPL